MIKLGARWWRRPGSFSSLSDAAITAAASLSILFSGAAGYAWAQPARQVQTGATGSAAAGEATAAHNRTGASASIAQSKAPRQVESADLQQQQTNKAGVVHNRAGSASTKDKGNETPFGSFASSNRGPISIQSDSLALDYKGNLVVFRGHVHATQADGTLTSDVLNVKYGKDFRQIQHMVADGNVHMSQGVRWCSSDHAVMDQGQHTVTLTGTPICHDARDQITGTKITVHLDSGKSDVDAARAVIFPQQSKTSDNEASAQDVK